MPTYNNATDWQTSKGKVVVHKHLSSPDNAAANTAAIEQQVRNQYPGAVPIMPATERYNCHAYAHANSHAWFDTPADFLADDCVKVTGPLAIQPGDRYIYAASGVITHSAVVLRAQAGQPVVFQSKWGAWPVVEHGERNVPSAYGAVIAIYRRRGALSEQDATMSDEEGQTAELLKTFTSEERLQELGLASSPQVVELIVRSWPEFASLVLEGPAAEPSIESAIELATGSDLTPLVILAGQIGTPRMLRALLSIARSDAVDDETMRLAAKTANAIRIALEPPGEAAAEMLALLDKLS